MCTCGEHDMKYRNSEAPFRLAHPSRPSVTALVGHDGGGSCHLDVVIDDEPLFRFLPSTRLEVHRVMECLVSLGFFRPEELLHALRWTRWFRPDEIHHNEVRRAARLLFHLRSGLNKEFDPFPGPGPDRIHPDTLQTTDHPCPLCGWSSPRPGKCDACW